MKKYCSTVLFLAAVVRLSAQIEIVSGGNVGIGTASPGAKLEVIGGSNPFGLIVEGDGSSANARIGLRRANSTSATGNIDWIGNDNSVGARIGVNDDIGGSMAFKLGGSAIGNTRLFISSAGNVGVGTTSPSQTLTILAGTNKSIGLGISGDGVNPGLSISDTTGNLDRVLVRDAANGITVGDIDNNGGALYLRAAGSTDLFISSGHNVGVGTTTPSYKLEVAGSVRATSFISNSTTYADFVFKPGYQLPSLAETEAAIQRDGHLPGIPSEAEARAQGIDLSAMQVKLLQKVEELTLHVIAQEKRLAAQQEEIRALRNQLHAVP